MTNLNRHERAAREGTIEHRRFQGSVEVRDVEDGGAEVHLTGYATTFDNSYRVGGEQGWNETIARGALRQCLAEGPDTPLLINHTGMPIARTRSGTLTLAEDARGLKIDADLDPSDPDVQAIIPKLRRRDVDSMSLAFRALGQVWNEDRTQRTITALTIDRGDVSLVAQPANEDTTASLRSAVRLLMPLSYIEKVKLKKAKLLGGESRADKPKYTPEQVQKLGEEGKAHKRITGRGYHFPIADSEDVQNGVLSLGRAKLSERPAIARFIRRRAVELKAARFIPDHWAES